MAELLILERIFSTMEAIVANELGGAARPLLPSDFFDLIGGTSTGGWVFRPERGWESLDADHTCRYPTLQLDRAPSRPASDVYSRGYRDISLALSAHLSRE